MAFRRATDVAGDRRLPAASKPARFSPSFANASDAPDGAVARTDAVANRDCADAPLEESDDMRSALLHIGKAALAAAIIAAASSAWSQSCERISAGDPAKRVIKGTAAPIKEWPAFASIRVLDASRGEFLQLCGGAAISPDWVVTAAHCVYGHERSGGLITARHELGAGLGVFQGKLEIVLNTDDLEVDDTARVFNATEVVIHPSYNPQTLQNDIALIRLNAPWNGATLPLALSPAQAPDGGRAYVAGFGWTRNLPASNPASVLDRVISRKSGRAGYAGSRRLMAALMPLASDGACLKSHPGQIDTRAQFCAGFPEGGRDSCSADSGGPLVAVDRGGCPYGVGLVSWGSSLCGQSGKYGVYTRISSYGDFIRRHVPNVRAPSAPPETKLDAMLAAYASIERWLKPAIGKAKVEMKRHPQQGADESNLDKDHPNAFLVGDEMHLEIKTSVGGVVTVLDFNAAGEIAALHSERLAAGASMRLPQNEDLAFPTAETDLGEGAILALIAPPGAGLDLTSAAGERDVDAGATIVGKIADAVPSSLSDPAWSGWAAGVVRYRIDPRRRR